MSGSDAPTHNELSAMKVDELRNICGELGLMVSGKKAELIDRILAQYEPKDAVVVGSDISRDIVKDSPETEVGDAVDRLLAKFEGKGDVEEAEDVEVRVEGPIHPSAALPRMFRKSRRKGFLTAGPWNSGLTTVKSGWKEVMVGAKRKPAVEEDEIMVADIVEEPANTKSDDEDTWKIPERDQADIPTKNDPG